MSSVVGNPAEVGAAPAKKQKASRLWWHVHQWVGLKLSIFMAFILLTGSLAVVSHEIDWLIQPSLRVAPSSVAAGEPNWSAIAISAAEYPRTARVRSIDAPTASAFATRVTVDWEDGTLGYLHIHPTTGIVQGEGRWVGAQRILRNMHRHLNLPTKYGVPLVSALSVLLLISFVTSMIVYKKWWRGFLRSPRQRNARTWWGDFHRLAGVWSLWFVLLIGVTGLWYLVESLGGDAPPMAEGKEIAGEVDHFGVGRQLAPSLAAARAADPALVIERIRFPDDGNASFIFEGQKSAWLVRPRANAVWTATETGKVMLVTDAADLGVHQRIGEMADPLHFGTFGGYWTKIPWFLFGLLMTALSVSGVAIYALRIGHDVREKIDWKANAPAIWRGMGWWKWPALAAVFTGFVLLPELFGATAG
jgi:uncharacterized iron-regulated membrane protein